jgi:hypothetical protein
MIKRFKKMIVLGVTMTFLTLLPVHSLPLPAGQVLSQDKDAVANTEQTQKFIEKEQQIGYQASSKKLLPTLLVIAAVAAGVFLLVMLVSKEKYDITGDWDFHTDYTTEGYADFDSVWRFTASDAYSKIQGTYLRDENGKLTQGQYTVFNKIEVLFQDDWMSEQYVGQFDSKTTMSGTFVLATGAEGTWTATKK